MDKRVLVIALLLLLIPTVAYAHVVGAFKDFLAEIDDESATQRLVDELENTRQQIESLSPRVARLQEEFAVKQDEHLPLLTFYHTIGPDVYMNFIVEADSIVDALANVRLMEVKLAEDLTNLNRLYLDYMQMKTARDGLVNYERLLDMIDMNLTSREQFLADYGHLSEEAMAQAAEDKWAKDANVLDEILRDDRQKIDRRIRQLIVRTRLDAPFRIEEELVNRYTELDYYIQSDHVYVHYAKDQVDIILIGIVTRDDEQTASLKFEAGFMNGIRISDLYMRQMIGFQIDYRKLAPDSRDFYVEQTNGAIVVMPVEISGE